MTGVVRKGDMSQGHGCFPSRPNIDGSSDVFVDGIPIHRKGDRWLVHTCGNNTHDGVMSSGSSSVFANGQPVARIGDSISCGDKAKTGSSSVFSG